ncbi:DUF87 domain-containing protein [Suttonella sp. R2A3]|uniref:helicase HerA domain-containing protein n=1 Tax=Suttonella sp. R2A3 TaxID=2908648 RepID=UPI001F3F7BC8|nr:DUF87 domain-containing protein [Suttonella sp. R2A3]UJF25187.1 DUF87 domain-containing protein [Suttonella sp. R2A3]
MNIEEQIGQFYIGTDIDDKNAAINYDAADLTTHAVIVGMTGSGKTGLGIGLLEEAALDSIPVIAIDPKGDLGNLALNFPQTRAQDFAPWADEAMLTQAGMSRDEWAEKTAKTWREGIAGSGQGPERMQALKDANPVTIYTPGSQDGVPLSLLADLAPPNQTIRSDINAYSEALDATAAALLSLIGNAGDPLAPTHVFLTQVLRHHWDAERSLTLAELIKAILEPPFASLGVMPLDDVISANERRKLAMSLNSLLASPSFANWMNGKPLDCQRLFYDSELRPQTAVLNIAHLSDSERMFFVTLLLSNLISWMRQQPGSGSLRAIVYMDEIFGYLPPTANPPSKTLFLTLLKQARAYGLGLVLSTQNPVDLDYKALSNAGTWFVGRLQTAQDRARLRDGLLSASSAQFSADDLDNALDKLGKRVFLLHNIHEQTPCLFHTRWVMSYLAGPMDSQRLKQLKPKDFAETNTIQAQSKLESAPVLPEGVRAYYAPSVADDSGLTHYHAHLLAHAKIFYSDKVSDTRHETLLKLRIPFNDNAEPDWQKATPLKLAQAQLGNTPQRPVNFDGVPSTLSNADHWKTWDKALGTYLRQEQTLSVLFHKEIGIYSEADEDEQSFRQRIIPEAHAARDSAMNALRQKYASKQSTLERQLITAETRVDRESSQSSQSMIDAGLSIGSALLGAFMGRKVMSKTNMRAASSALRRAGRVQQQRQDVANAEAKLTIIQEQLDTLDANLAAELMALRQQFDPQTMPLETRTITALARDIDIKELAVLYTTQS